METGRYPLDWIDAYAAAIREFVVVRPADNLLIKVPNEAYRLNSSGVRILQTLFSGGRVDDLWATHGRTEMVRRDLYEFFTGLKQVLQGCVDESNPPPGVTRVNFTLPFSTLPVLAEVAVTGRCNLACKFCYAACSCRASTAPGREMTGPEIRRVLDVIHHDAQVPSVSFTGGEPCLRANLAGLVAYAHGLGLRVNLITNGTRVTPALARDLAAAGLASAQVSLEAPDAATHDRLTTVAGSFDATLAGIAALLAAGIRVHTNTTMNRLNLDRLTAMPAFVRGLGLTRLSMNLMIPAGTAAAGMGDLVVRYTELPGIIPGLAAAARAAGVEFMWYSPTPVCLFNPLAHRLGNKGCAACDGLLSVDSAGNVLPCSSWPEPVGSLLDTPFAGVWNSARAAWIRAKRCAPSVCDGCPDFTLCQGACPLYWDQCGHAELAPKEAGYVPAT